MSPLQALAPDQRAILELLLRQGRSYAELSELLGLPEDAVRTRAHTALAALAPDRAAPAGEDGAVADWLLGQAGEDGDRTRESVAAIPAWQAWAAEVAGRLGDVDGATVPDVPEAGVTAPAPAPRARRARPVRDAAATPAAGTAPHVAAKPAAKPARRDPVKAAEPASAAAPAATGGLRSSRLGGAVLIGVLVVLVGVVVFVLFGRGDDGETTASTGTKGAASATATPTATPQVVSQVVLKGVGNQSEGLMQVLKREADGKLVFVLAAQKVPQNKPKEVYAVWFTKPGTAPRNLGYAQSQVGKGGTFATGGPQSGQENAFAGWLTSYDNVVVARATADSVKSRQPGQIVLRGRLPGGS